MRIAAVILLCAAVVGCATNSGPSAPDSLATVNIRSITPQAGSAVDATSVIQAEIEYTISNFQPQAEYYLAPLFESTEGPGRTFNEFERVTDGWKLTQASGTVQIQYAIAREWRNASLARPVRVTFKVMVRTGAHSTKVIGGTESVQFPAAV